MASGIITLTKTGSAKLYGQILWESVSNGSQANSSEVTATIQLRRTSNEYTTTGTWKGELTVGSVTEKVSLFTAVSGEWVTIHSVTTTVKHDAQGKGKCYIYGKLNGPTETTMQGTYVSGGQTVELDSIGRFATIISATDFTDEENPTITYSVPNAAQTTKLQACISVTGDDDDIEFRDIPISGKSYTFSLTTAERNVLRAAAANSNTLSLKFVVRSTVSGVEGKTNTKATMTVVNANPTATFAVVDTNSATTALTGNSNNFIALHSTPKVTLNVTTKKSATIPSKGVEITDGVTVWKKNGSFEGAISPLSSGDISYKVTDSRGNMVGGGVKRTFIEYFNPTIQIDSIARDGSGNLTVVASGEAFVGSFGKSSNTRTVYYRYRKSTDENYTAWAALSSSEVTWDGTKFTATKRISGLDYKKSYNVHVSIVDSLHAYPGVIARATGLSTIPLFDWGADSFNFNVPVYDLTGAQIGNSESVWQNPPMQPAVEYRTLELYQGMPVYVKLLALGQLPASGQKTTAHNIQNLAQMIAFEAFAKARGTSSNFQQFPFINAQGAVVAKAQATASNAIIQVFSDLSTYDGFIKLKYTKTS